MGRMINGSWLTEAALSDRENGDWQRQVFAG